MTDADLVARARQGDAAAFGELVDRHRTSVYRAALAALRSHAEAEDAAQDAFLLAYRRLNSFRGEASFKTWLLTITWHQSINRRRALSRIWRRIAEPAPGLTTGDEVITHEAMLASIASTGLSPEAAAAHEQLRRSIHKAIGRLSSKLRDAIVLAQSGEYSYEEIASMLDVPVGTVKWRVSEARRQVKRQLHQQGFGDGR